MEQPRGGKLDLSKYVQILRRRFWWWTPVVAFGTLLGLFLFVLIAKTYNGRLLLRRRGPLDVVELTSRSRFPDKADVVANTLRERLLSPATVRDVLLRTTGLLPMEDRENVVAVETEQQRLITRVSVIPISADLVLCRYLGSTPHLARTVLHSLVSAFREQTLRRFRDDTGAAVKEAGNAVEEARSQAAAAQERLRQFLIANPWMTPDQLGALRADLKAAQRTLQDVHRDLSKVTDELRYVEEQMEETAPLVQKETVKENPEVAALNQRIAELKNALTEAKLELTPDHPRYKRFTRLLGEYEQRRRELPEFTREEREEPNPRYLRLQDQRVDLQGDRKALEARARDLMTRIREDGERVRRIPELRARYDRWQQGLDITVAELRRLQQRLDEIRLASASARAGEVSFDQAGPATARVTPNLKGAIVGLVGAIFGSLGLGLALVFGAEYVDQSLRSIDEAREFLRIPSLGAIPAIETAEGRHRRQGRILWAVLIGLGFLLAFALLCRLVPPIWEPLTKGADDLLRFFQ